MADADPPQRILLVRPSALGDVARTAPVLASLRRADPRAEIDWLVQDGFVDAVAHHPALTAAVPFARRGLRFAGLRPRATGELLRLRRTLREKRYDLVLDAQGLIRSASLAWLTGAKRRVGFADAREGAWLLYTERYRVDPAITHSALRMLALARMAGVDPVPDARLYVGPEDAAWAERWLAQRRIATRGFVAIAPTTRWLSKDWPAANYAALARRLLRDDVTPFVLFLATPGEWARAAPEFDRLPPTRFAAPPLTVGRLMALLQRARLLVCNDSAALHLAVGLATPSVSIFGPTDPALVGPLGTSSTVLRPDHAPPGNTHRQRPDDQSLIARVTLDEVIAAIDGRLTSTTLRRPIPPARG
ncbi:MAG: glycosyltransferase family 9 protein [Planctomycetota bacterium]